MGSFLWPSTFLCSWLQQSKMPNAENAPTHAKKTPMQTIYLIAAAAVSRLYSICLPYSASGSECWQWRWLQLKPNCNFWLLFHTRDLNRVCSWKSTMTDGHHREGREKEINLLGFILTYWSPSHQRMDTDLTFFKIKSEPYFFSLPEYFSQTCNVFSLLHKGACI